MRKGLFYILLPLLLTACEKAYDNSTYGPGAAIVSNNTGINFEELVFLFRPIVVEPNDSTVSYLAVDRIRNLEIKLNAKPWGSFQSDVVDTVGLKISNKNGLPTTSAELDYLFLATYTHAADSLFTAGDFADYLNEFVYLRPGDYVCEISSFEVIDDAGEIRLFKPRYFTHFVLEEGVRSVYLGEIVVEIDSGR